MRVSDSVDHIPSFKDGVEQFRSFLRNLGHDGNIVWTFREDFYSGSNSHMWIRWPPPDVNAAVAARCFEAGRSRGLVEIAALCCVGASVAATVFAPAPDEIQGWNQGLKLSVRTTLTQAEPVSSGLLWAFHRRRPECVHFQQRDTFVHSRSVAA
jgi:hypothetical protein